MRTIPVEEAQVGDVVAEPVQDKNGRVLLPQGSRLSAAVLSRLKSWGVFTIHIEGEDPEAGKSAQDLLEELEHRFEGMELEPLMMQIKKIARQHLEER